LTLVTRKKDAISGTEKHQIIKRDKKPAFNLRYANHRNSAGS